MEPLQRLTRRQVEALQVILSQETLERGAPLNAIARRLKVSPPSALGHLTPLEEMGLITRHRGKSRLTPEGRSTLVEYQRHHRVAESMFGKMGLSPKDIHTAALEVDLSLSHLTVERVCAAGGHPERCPHGEPIPPCRGRSGGKGAGLVEP